MGKCLFILITLAVLAAAVLLGCLFVGKTCEIPAVKDGWFGRGSERPMDETVIPFTVNVSNDTLKDLQQRLENARLGEDLENVKFEYGFQVRYMKEVLDYWKNNYNWRQEEALLNKFPHFKTNIEGIVVHFIHVKPKMSTGKMVRPLLLIHGWPGSVFEFYKLLPMLTDPASYGGSGEDAFEVICPSIPGYGFSEAAHQPGMNTVAVGRIFVKLMARLGHHSFYLQGGDWGAIISTFISQAYPENTLGLHVNMIVPPKGSLEALIKQIVGNYFPSLIGISQSEYDLFYPLDKMLIKLVAASGYMHLQATKPDTLAFALNDSPVGLAAYIMEKFGAWTNLDDHLNSIDGAITKKFTLDELLTNVMIYWITGSIGSSIRLYRESLAGFEEVEAWESVKVTVPTGLAAFPHDVVVLPRAIAEVRYKNIVQYTVMPQGGHFAALEEPRLLADDLLAFVKKVESQ